MTSKRQYWRHLLFTCLGLWCQAVAALAPADLDQPATLTAFADGAMNSLLMQQHTASAVLALSRGGQPVMTRGFGMQDVANSVAVDGQQTLFRIGSVSKLFTWVAVMQQVEQGRLDLDTDVNAYLEQVEIEDSWPGKPVTLRHIMTHTAGFEDGFLGYLITLEPEQIKPLREAMQRYQPQRVNPPGEISAYSNYATALAGLIVANVSGQRFEDYIQEHIFDVLGMTSSTFVEPLPDALSPHMAVAYKRSNGSYQAQPYELISSFAPAGSMAATAPDMLRFGQALINGGSLGGRRILEPESVDALLAQQFTYDRRIKGIGLGFLHYPANTPAIGHDGGTFYFATHFAVLPEDNTVVFASFSGPGYGQAMKQFKQLFYGTFYPAERAETRSLAKTDLVEFAGEYQSWRANFSGLDKVNALFSRQRVTATDHGLSINDTLYLPVDDDLFQAAESGRRLAFLRDTSGRASGFAVDGEPYVATFRLPAYATTGFSLAFLLIGLLASLHLLLRRYYQRAHYAALAGGTRRAQRVLIWSAALHMLTFVLGGITLAIVGGSLLQKIPLLFKMWLCLPLLATACTLWLVKQNAVVWRQRLLMGSWARLRYTIASLALLGLAWLYYYWNILGFQYLS
ncbi:beta-lactamase family protein [Pseudohalioglobus sediminis]|uniref:Beta-lactamase family protein n=1 Tax=Pseudohalioglobus sediminis TaxID=2606449 RepID=A0A5B0X6D5_9GAMM|nr:serine hydrolase domain-containing protein [Pseudohalioglobus sediminis]KAA1194128.1 beta-lactamase family protein [Pseudohalioglobus sediminis]